ncbi:toll-like receptor 4 [Haliotis cracherodii]|uniref:toll-like receptor 4 n=1 Tax=Haliotis cracherodii TaxID=6455 RepID=UPI0039E93C87
MWKHLSPRRRMQFHNGLWTLMLLASVAVVNVVFSQHLCPPCKCFDSNGSFIADCSNHNLTRIPSFLPNYTKELLISGNNVIKLSNDSFVTIPLLTRLDLSNNNINLIETAAFANMSNLRYLSLQGNNLAYNNLSSSIFQNLQNLTVLYLNNNIDTDDATVEYPSDAIQRLSSLTTLYVDGLKDKIFASGFLKLKNLINLTIESSNKTCDMYNITLNTFKYLPYLEHVKIIQCNLHFIAQGSFRHQHRLKTLNLSQNNELTFKGVTNATHEIASSLEGLFIDEIVNPHAICVIITKQFCENLKHTNLTELHANMNRVTVFQAGALRFLPPSLKKVYLKGNRFEYYTYIGDISSLVGLEVVDLGGYANKKLPFQSLADFKQTSTCTDCNVLSERLSSTSLDDEVSSYLHNKDSIVTIHVPPNLRNVSFSVSQLYFHIGTFAVTENNITYIDVSRNLFTKWIGTIDGLEKLEYLDLSYNIANYATSDFFSSFQNLKRLNISHNLLGTVLGNISRGDMFKSLSQLQTLDLSANYINNYSSILFSNLSSLKELHISRNRIYDLRFNISHMKNLNILQCSGNELPGLTEDFTASLDKLSDHHNLTVDLSQNPIQCTCINLPFLSWMVTANATGRISFGNLSEYDCLYDNVKSVILNDLEKIVADLNVSCQSFPYHFGFFVGISLVVLVTLSLLICSLLYRFRWKLKYLYYAARHRYRTTHPSNHTFVFDAFVSFAEEDRDFVVNELLVKLEDESDMSLNFHQRDFTPGRPIAHNIIEAVKTSKRTLVILSREFLKSHWCVHELQMAHMESVSTGRDVLLIVMMEHIPTNKIPVEILYHIQSDSYLEYPLEGEKVMFWRNLIGCLRE